MSLTEYKLPSLKDKIEAQAKEQQKQFEELEKDEKAKKAKLASKPKGLGRKAK